MKTRHAVRQFDGKPLDEHQKQLLEAAIIRLNQESGQDFQLLTDDPQAFRGMLARYGSFSGVVNYIALVGNSEEKLGYFGEELVRICEEMNLKTC